MARPLRMDQEDTCYHVLNRGNERRAIFRDDGDREGFLTRLGRHRERATRDALMYWLWREGRFRLGQIAPHFDVGYAAVSQACRRTERRLENDRQLQRLLRGRIE